MNFYTVAAKILKDAKKAKNHSLLLNPEDKELAQRSYDTRLQFLLNEHEKIMELGISLMNDFKKRITQSNHRVYLITIRPPHTTNWHTFLHSVNQFIQKYGNSYSYIEWAFEQIGTTTDELGKGFHVHILGWTTKINYYPSHILRDSIKIFTYVAENCIDVQTVINIKRATEYIRGIKNNTEKKAAVDLNPTWRTQMNIENLYSLGSSPITEAIEDSNT